MTLEEKTYRTMQKDSIAYLQLNEALWTPKIRIKTNVDLLKTNDKELDVASQAQENNNPGGLVDQKNHQFEVLADNFYSLSCKLRFYAKDTGDMVLLKDVDISESELKHSVLDTLALCGKILKQAKNYLLIAKDCDLTAEELTKLEKDLEDANKLPIAVNITTNERKSATRSIKEINSESRLILDKLDDALEGMFAGNKDLLEGWFQVRKIKGRPLKKKKAE